MKSFYTKIECNGCNRIMTVITLDNDFRFCQKCLMTWDYVEEYNILADYEIEGEINESQ